MALKHPNDGSYWQISSYNKNTEELQFWIWKNKEHRDNYKDPVSIYSEVWMPYKYVSMKFVGMTALIMNHVMTDEEKALIVNPLDAITSAAYVFLKTRTEFNGFTDI